MSDLIDELEQDHREILGHLLRIRAADYRREVCLVELRQARDKFLRHVGRDEGGVFWTLVSDPDTAGIARRCQRQMRALSHELLGFLERFGRPDAEAYGIEFAMELGRMTQRLRHQMHIEESRIYPLVRRRLQARRSRHTERVRL